MSRYDRFGFLCCFSILAGGSVSLAKQQAVQELMGEFKWGMAATEVQNLVMQGLEKDYQERIRKAAEPWEQQKLHDELDAKRKEIRDSYVRFEGQKTGWDVSYLDKEFGHKNGESMFFRWEQDQRRFFFFWQDKLYKMVVALSQEQFSGKPFGEFAKLMQERYGKAQTRFSTNAAGEQWADGLSWPASGVTVLSAIDHTAFYGNFILSLYDSRESVRVVEGRRVNAPRTTRQDDAIEEALRADKGSVSNIDEDVVDRLTGRASEGAEAASQEEGLAPMAGKSNQGEKKVDNKKPVKAAKPRASAPVPSKKPVASENPLEGLP